MTDNRVILSDAAKERIQIAFRAYWLSPFCSGVVQIGETLVGWALNAALTGGKAYADAFHVATKTAYQIKTGLVSSPVTFARLTTVSQLRLVNSARQDDADLLGRELLAWSRERINEPRAVLGAEHVHVARLIYTKTGQFTYYERDVIDDPHDPSAFTWRWSEKGNALEGYYDGHKWFSWYPQGRLETRNQNQLHFHGENALVPPDGAPNRFDFNLGEPGRIPFNQFMGALQPLLDALPDDDLA